MSKGAICRNCGGCCGHVPITPKERKRIEVFLKKRPDIAKKARNKPFSSQCVFRDDETKHCLVYSCRPDVCRAYTCSCSSSEWGKAFKRSHFENEFRLINELFGSPILKKAYENIRKEIFHED